MEANFLSDCEAKERRKVEVQRQAHEAERQAQRLSGFGVDLGPFREPSEAVIAERAKRLFDNIEAFRASPRGRFLAALNSFDQSHGYDKEAYAVRGIYARALADDRKPVDVEAVGRIIRILAPLNLSDARLMIQALADLLAPELARAA